MSSPSVPSTSRARAGDGTHPADGAWLRVCREALPRPLRSLLRSCRDAAVGIWRRALQHKNHVFVFADPIAGSASRGLLALEVERYDRVEKVAPELRAELEAAFGAESLAADLWEIERGGVLWLARLDGALCGASMTRCGRHFRRWFVPLQPDDIVFFRNHTLPQFRGRGICPALMRMIVAREVGGSGARAYADCRVYNPASIRSIEKAGFRRIATLPPLSREQALGVSDRAFTTSGHS